LRAIQEKHADWGHWGTNPEKYSSWTNHSNRLIPIYTFGVDLSAFKGEKSVYRDEKRLVELYGRLPEETLNPNAEYLDQTDIYHLQKQAIDQGKKYIFLIIFDGMDWQSTRNAAIYQSKKIYDSGRGEGLYFLDYRTEINDYGYMVTSAHNSGTRFDVNAQTVSNPGGDTPGGYSAAIGGDAPWSKPQSDEYLIGRLRRLPHCVTDSSSSATSMTAGIKTFNTAINVAPDGTQVEPLARALQRDKEWSIGVVTSVTISHATPAAAYANNVSRSDYQDLARDMVGLPSVSHREEALSGVDVLMGGGWRDDSKDDRSQGDNFIPGNKYLIDDDIKKIDVEHGGKYRVVQRQAGKCGSVELRHAAERAAKEGTRLFAFYSGTGDGNLPYRTADGSYDPTIGVNSGERYTRDDLYENVTLAEMVESAITVLETNKKGFWMMIESGDVDWANHKNNIDDSIGAVISGDMAFRKVIEWIEGNNAWKDSAVILTADHGHYFNLDKPEALLGEQQAGQ
jgi:alkaline phosphatase